MLTMSVNQEHHSYNSTIFLAVANKTMEESAYIDFASPFINRMFLLKEDKHLKWLEVE